MKKTIENFITTVIRTSDDPLTYNTYSIKVLEEMSIRKGDLAELMGITSWDGAYDTALPQEWLDDFVEKSGLPYNQVLSTTFWCYPKAFTFGFPVSGCEEVANKLHDRIPMSKIADLG